MRHIWFPLAISKGRGAWLAAAAGGAGAGERHGAVFHAGISPMRHSRLARGAARAANRLPPLAAKCSNVIAVLRF
jgi:hypothetical protein